MFRGGRGGARYDNFRARVQNTSRPPSMHVDDFVAMESGRGRGRGRGGQSPMSERSATRPSIRKVGVDSGRMSGIKVLALMTALRKAHLFVRVNNIFASYLDSDIKP